MSDLCAQLDSLPIEKEEAIQTTLTEISHLLEELSTFELLGSGLIKSLLDFLTRKDTTLVPLCYDDRLQRVKIFTRIFLDLSDSSKNTSKSSVPPLVTLVRQLHEALDKEEAFKVAIYDTTGSASSLKLLAQPLKFKLRREGTKIFLNVPLNCPLLISVHLIVC